jgi:hypothetical protein
MQHDYGIPAGAGVELGGLTVSVTADEKGFVRIRPEQIEWHTPAGAGSTPLALLEGDLSSPDYAPRIKI